MGAAAFIVSFLATVLGLNESEYNNILVGLIVVSPHFVKSTLGMAGPRTTSAWSS